MAMHEQATTLVPVLALSFAVCTCAVRSTLYRLPLQHLRRRPDWNPCCSSFQGRPHGLRKPLADTFVDIWHCNSTGFYSGYTREANACTFRLSFHTRRSTRCTVRYHGTFFSSCSVRNHDYSKRQLTRRSTSAGSSTTSSGGQISTVTDTLTWLRGIVQTNEDGIAECETIVPERYSGCAPHIHSKVLVLYR
ncbi:hypothetical protein WJX77_001041 [Trebouxia sp. C0004]